MEESLSALEACGIDTKEGVERFMNSEELFMKFLLRFLEDTGMEEMMRAYEVGNVTECFHAAHSLKALTGNLAISCLYNLLKTMVEELRSGSFPAKEKFSTLYADYSRVIETLQTIKEK